ncbi:MAG TPA: hypothetical protein VF493_13400 [Terriglobales bacterium]
MPCTLRLRWAALSLIFGCVAIHSAQATPIKAKPEDVIKQLTRPRMVFPAARAGWNGPEPNDQNRSFNLLLEQYGPEGSTRAARASLIEAAQPDLRIFAAIGMAILLMRVLRSREQLRVLARATSSPDNGNQLTTPAAEPKELKAA